MNLHIYPTPVLSGAAAAAAGAQSLREALANHPLAHIIVATGASQFEMLSRLIEEPDLAWSRVVIFHLDEYLGLPITHPASFRKYLWERFVSRLPQPPHAFHAINGEGDAAAECGRLGELIGSVTIDVAFIGIGENAHLAFNDPPADFAATGAYHVVTLDEACRAQQFGEGWFPSLDAVPTQAISMTIPEILRSRRIICTVPDARKAAAVKGSVEGPITPEVPGSILQRHPATDLFLDEAAAGLLK
jgi:glucosamine-6-phosphate deaminase